MKYKREINEAYQRIGFKPRDNQLEYVNEIVAAIIDEGKVDIVVSAPTGTGKSIIAAAAADTIGILKGNPAVQSVSDSMKGNEGSAIHRHIYRN